MPLLRTAEEAGHHHHNNDNNRGGVVDVALPPEDYTLLVFFVWVCPLWSPWWRLSSQERRREPWLWHRGETVYGGGVHLASPLRT